MSLFYKLFQNSSINLKYTSHPPPQYLAIFLRIWKGAKHWLYRKRNCMCNTKLWAIFGRTGQHGRLRDPSVFQIHAWFFRNNKVLSKLIIKSVRVHKHIEARVWNWAFLKSEIAVHFKWHRGSQMISTLSNCFGHSTHGAMARKRFLWVTFCIEAAVLHCIPF